MDRNEIIKRYMDSPDSRALELEAWMIHLATGCDGRTAALQAWAKFYRGEDRGPRPTD